MKLLVINGPNLNFLGIREKGIYGTQDYQYLVDLIGKKAQETGSEIEVWQSNHEGAIIDKIQEAYFNGTEGIIINPGAYTHYSYAIRDALASITVPKVEIHISDITQREEFRKTSVTKEACDGSDEAEHKKDLAAQKTGDKRTDVGCKIDKLDVSARGAHIQLTKIAEDKQQERARAGAIKAIICADQERSQIYNGHLPAGGNFPALLRQLPLPQYDKGNNRQHNQQQILQIDLGNHQLQPGAEV